MTKTPLAVAVALAGSVVLSAQDRPVFHAQTNYVEIDVVPTDKGGHFLPGLTASDFELREEGALQAIETFSFVDLPIGPGVSSAGTPSPARLNPALKLQPGDLDGRLYLIFLDPNAGIVPLQSASSTMSQTSAFGFLDVRRRAREFVSGYLQPGDLAAVWNAENKNTSLTFTTDRAELLKAIDGERGAPMTAAQGTQLRDAIDLLSGIQGRRKSLILFTEGAPVLISNRQDPVTGTVFPEVSSWMGGLGGGRGPGRLALAEMDVPQLDITGRADVHIYTFDTRGLVAPGANAASTPHYLSGDVQIAAGQVGADYGSIMLSTMDLASIASETGGLSFINSNDFKKGYRQIVEDNSRYYVLGYYSPRKTGDGGFIPVSVKTTRKDITIRARKGYFAR